MHLDDEMLAFIESLYRKEALLLYRYSKTVFSNSSIAEETVQETFIIACLNYNKLVNSPNPEGWIMNTHKNVCHNIQKAHNTYLKKILTINHLESLSSFADPTYGIESDLNAFVNSDDYMILKKIILEGYSHKDLANELNVSVDVCKKRFQRAKERFKKNYHK